MMNKMWLQLDYFSNEEVCKYSRKKNKMKNKIKNENKLKKMNF